MTSPTRAIRLGLACTAAFAFTASGWLLAAQPAPDKGPGQTYVAYRAAVQKAKAIEDLAPWLAKESRAMIDETPADERPMLFGMLQDMSGAMTDLKIVSEKIDGETAELAVEATADGAKTKGTVTMRKEDGAWRLVTERWHSGM